MTVGILLDSLVENHCFYDPAEVVVFEIPKRVFILYPRALKIGTHLLHEYDYFLVGDRALASHKVEHAVHQVIDDLNPLWISASNRTTGNLCVRLSVDQHEDLLPGWLLAFHLLDQVLLGHRLQNHSDLRLRHALNGYVWVLLQNCSLDLAESTAEVTRILDGFEYLLLCELHLVKHSDCFIVDVAVHEFIGDWVVGNLDPIFLQESVDFGVDFRGLEGH